jgi:hypothetical protein
MRKTTIHISFDEQELRDVIHARNTTEPTCSKILPQRLKEVGQLGYDIGNQ